MKNVLIFTIIGLLLFGCKPEEKRTDFIINGKAEGVYNGVRAYLKKVEKKGRERIIDTAVVINEKFNFSGKVLYPTLSVIEINSVNGKLKFMLENSSIDITIDKSNLSQSKIEGSASQDDYQKYQEDLQAYRKEVANIRTELRNNRSSHVLTQRDSLMKIASIAEKKYQELPLKFINSHPSSYYSLALIEQESANKNANIDNYLAAFNSLDPELQSSPKGISLKIALDNLLTVYQKKSRVEIGKIAPNFKGTTPNGTTVSLNEVKGKVTIIDFWAAWCGPCRRENPNVVKIYNTYHNDGLEIIGVSLDGARGQKNPKQAWIDAIAKDNLTWTQVSSLQYFKDPIAELYNINAIPATFILDAEGKIVAKNLRGYALEAKVKELLSQ
ncbi:TlpA disulfide reductase family protein [Winogradskyella sediminis]|uniref:TlpA disulfide reductase family protein n=1 Tax=Winogradskyella sediminis TaxID=1382466 RepID=UPI000E381EF8|nr:TlpA disulfide reductase family protein [Winogradskyella sediminis]REG87862.1 peroxiredoxin [Winogradskyella sediminis]